MTIRTGATLFLLALSPLTSSLYAQNRTVIDSEMGNVFTTITGFNPLDWGFFLEVTSNTSGTRFAPQAVKLDYSRFEAFAPSDSSTWPYFPYAQLQSYSNSEVAAGRAPIFMTATYQGIKRPLVFSWDLKLSGSRPTSAPADWHYAVNVGDPRFVRFWVNQYLRPILWPKVNTTQNLWFGLDETAFTSGVFGVIDNNGNYVSGVPWDQPFPQDANAWLTAIKSFFDQVHQLAPEIRLIPNVGAFSDPTKFSSILANVPGILYENFWDGPAPVAYTRNARVSTFSNVSAFGAAGKVGDLRMWVAKGSQTQLTSAFSLYELVKGPNFFFTPMYTSTMTGVTPSSYQPWEALLGNATAPYTQTPQVGMRAGYNFYSRTYDGGIVYLNWSGVTKTVTLPSGTTYFDVNGNQVSSISIPDGVGTFVSTSKARVARPKISPRYGSVVTGPLSVTIACDTPNAIVHYTTDDSTPTSGSPQYGGAIPLFASASVKAVAFLSGEAGSAVSTADYTILSETPTAQFAAASDTGLAGTGYAVVQLSSVSTKTVSIPYTITNPNNSTSTGTATVIPGDLYGHITIPAVGSSGQRFIVRLGSPTNAALGSATVFNYIVQ